MRQVMVLLAVLVGWSESTTAQTSDAEEVKATLVAMWDAIENGDLERYASHLHPDFTSFGESDVYLNSGKQYEVRNIGDYLQRAHGVHTEMHQPEVTVIGTVAWITYHLERALELNPENRMAQRLLRELR